MRKATVIVMVSAGLLVVLGSGCGQPRSGGDPFLARGVKLREGGEYGAAAAALEHCLRRNPAQAEARLRLALLYEDHLGEPLRALYHFSLYLRAGPRGTNADLARQSVERLQRAWLTDLLERYPEPLEAAAQGAAELARENARLLEQKAFLLERLRAVNREVTELRERIARGQPPSSTDAASPDRPLPPPPSPAPPAGGVTYEVRKGDTLSEVSRLLYGSSRYWRALRKANSQILTNGDILVPGMTLRVPPQEDLEVNP